MRAREDKCGKIMQIPFSQGESESGGSHRCGRIVQSTVQKLSRRPKREVGDFAVIKFSIRLPSRLYILDPNLGAK